MDAKKKPIAYESWSDEETLLLVDTRIKYDNYFTGSKGNAAKGWKKIIEKLAKLGVTRSNHQKFKRKWSVEVQEFKKLLEPSSHNSGIGCENGEETAMDSAVFDKLYDFLVSKHQVQPPVLMDTSLGSSRTKDETVSTGQTSYLGLDDCYDHDYSIPPEYVEEVVIEPEVVREVVTSPAKSSPRAIKMVRAVPGLDVQTTASEKRTVSDNAAMCSIYVKSSAKKRCSDYYGERRKVDGVNTNEENGDENQNGVRMNVKENTTSSEDSWLKSYLQRSYEERKMERADRKEEFG